MNASYPFANTDTDTSTMAALDAEIAANKAIFDAAMTHLNARKAALMKPVPNGSFVPGQMYTCIRPNAKAKKGLDGKPRFTADATYLCIANSTSEGESKDRPPVFLIDNNFRSVHVGTNAKIKTTFRLA